MRWRSCRWLSLIVVLTLAWGGAAPDGRAAGVERMMAAASGCDDVSSSGACEHCGNGDAMPAAACASLCGVSAAPPPGLAQAAVLTRDAVTPLVARAEAGLLGPPDPYPPRPAILS